METQSKLATIAAGHCRYKSIDTTINDPLPCPSRPTEDEAELYYRGLGDSAKLIARSSREPIQLYRSRGLLSKHFKSPTPHPQLDQHFKPNSALVADLIQRLNKNMIEDCRMFVTTVVGPSHVSRLTLCILVTASDAPDWSRAQRAVDACLKVLWHYEIYDVEVEMMSTLGAIGHMQRGPQAADRDMMQKVQQLPVQVQKQSVAKASQLLNDTEYNPHYMVAASEYLGTSLTPVGGTGYGCKGPHRSSAMRSVTRLQVYREQKQMTQASIELDLIDREIAAARSRSDSVLKILKYQDLTFGKVILSPPLARRAAPEPPALRLTKADWALISLDMSMFPSRNPRNRFYVPDDWVPSSIVTAATSLGLEFPNVRGDEGLPMHQIRGTASLDELRQETSAEKKVEHDVTGTIVCKYGPRTGLTFGVCNRYACVEKKAGCLETCDSGAGVVSLEGRLIGIVTSGDDDPSFDATWVTPYQTLREEFRDAADTSGMRDLSIALR
ncbi:uncharacterized protein J7T54_005214 [Emericellopsis cladophorae]|uniref:Uncharacterized protein n=1 Tax=Emericellopsis cladophorae TaxID=2686198 RepID=A0A9P9XXS7_9HYPO|nr:uncharacterized protein J7T54_005214 [Emericellopsis cladophorae]KAI6779400.1 hypothetical protein J7T54_005214 [Emericellopsis cladophorae]